MFCSLSQFTNRVTKVQRAWHFFDSQRWQLLWIDTFQFFHVWIVSELIRLMLSDSIFKSKIVISWTLSKSQGKTTQLYSSLGCYCCQLGSCRSDLKSRDDKARRMERSEEVAPPKPLPEWRICPLCRVATPLSSVTTTRRRHGKDGDITRGRENLRRW